MDNLREPIIPGAWSFGEKILLASILEGIKMYFLSMFSDQVYTHINIWHADQLGRLSVHW